MEADILAECKDGSCTPNRHHSLSSTDTRGGPTPTTRFLPTDDEQQRDVYWAITPNSEAPSHPHRSHPSIRVNSLASRSLVHAKTPWDLCPTLGHGMLGTCQVVLAVTEMPNSPAGWLSMLREGSLHRDVTIASILMLDPPVAVKPFEVRGVGRLMAQHSIQHEDKLVKYANLLGDMIKKMDFSDKCNGFIMNGDAAGSSEGHFASRGTGERSVSRIPRSVEGSTWYDFRAGNIRVHVQQTAGHSAGQGSPFAFAR